jgi:tRNA threonylcarbamoyladenosine biosynthesis protein TsaB
MKILAFDSTAKTASVAVTEDECLLGLYNIENGLTQSELLLPMAEDLLRSLKISFKDIELLAVTAGPGSFTGVRIGISLVKGIAFSNNIPCASVSTLEALMQNISSLHGILVPVMDARRNQVYNAIFRSDESGVARLTEDRAISIEELADELKNYSGEPIYLSGDGYKIAKAKLSELGIKTLDTPKLLINQNAYSTALIAAKKYQNGEIISDTEISPVYLRLPQAERERLEKEGNK